MHWTRGACCPSCIYYLQFIFNLVVFKRAAEFLVVFFIIAKSELASVDSAFEIKTNMEVCEVYFDTH